MKTKTFFETDPFGYVVKRRIDLKTGLRLALMLFLMVGMTNAGVMVTNASNIEYSGDYAIITFLQTGSITVTNQTLYNVSFLIVGGGGAGQEGYGTYPNPPGGGGGGGGVVEVPSYTLTPATYSAVVGLGARASPSDVQGDGSSFGSYSVLGGGTGGYASNSYSGGSGGGGSTNGATMYNGGAGSAYGKGGGRGYVSGTTFSSGGGGGASTNGTNGTQPNGGAGFCSSISGTSACYGGGGGGAASGAGMIGGAGGDGGGGIGAVANTATGGTGNTHGTHGVNGTGGGGGGNMAGVAGAGQTTSGGSGIIIVKMNISYYPMPDNATGYLTTCGGITNATAITWATYDIQFGNQINYSLVADMQQIYNYTLLTENFTATINDTANYSLCIYPENATAYAQTTDIFTAIGYNPINAVRNPTYYTNNTTIYETYMLSTTASKLVQIYVVDNTLSPLLDVKVKIQQTNPLTFQTLTIGTFDVDAFGSTTQALQPSTQLYHFSILDSNDAILQDYANRAIPCQSTDMICQLVLIVNPTSVIPIDISSLSGSCSYVSATRVITCVGNDTSGTLTSINLTAFAVGNSTAACRNGTAGSSATLTCTLPNVNGTYNAYLYGTDANLYNHLIKYGTYQVGTPSPTTYGRDGYLLAVILVVVAATLTSSIAVSMVMGVFGLFVAMAFGIIPLDGTSAVAVLLMATALMIAYKLKV